MIKWSKLPNKESLKKTIASLKANGLDVFLTENSTEAKKKVIELLPEGAEVMNMTSETLNTIRVTNEIQKSGKYKSVRQKLSAMDKQTQWKEMKLLGSAPDWVIGSVHAVTQDGQVMIASYEMSVR